MNHLSALLALAIAPLAQAQLINGGFEENGGFSLQGWEWGCGDPQPMADVPPGGGEWSAWKEPGHAKGCFPSLLIQRLTNVQYGVPYQLSGWVKCPQDEFSVCLGGTIGFGTVSSGEYTFAQSTTSQSEEWTFLTVDHVFDPGVGDTAIVILNSGFIGGPINPLPAGFDQITLDIANAIAETRLPTVSLLLEADNQRLRVGSSLPLRALECFDATGRSLLRQRASGTNTVLDLSSLTAGAYLIQVITDSGPATARFVKR